MTDHDRVRVLTVKLAEIDAVVGSMGMHALLVDLLAATPTATQILGPMPDGTIQIRYEDELRAEVLLLDDLRAAAQLSLAHRQLN